MEDRIVETEIAGVKYELLMSSFAINEITKRYGGLGNIETVLSLDNPEIYGETLYLITLLVNAAINFRNLTNTEKKPLLPEEFFLYATAPEDLEGSKNLLLECMNKGFKRNVKSEPNIKKKSKPQ